MTTTNQTPPPRYDQGWCDSCGVTHPDIIAEHCAKGQHCTYTTASCNVDWRMGDHAESCCDCGTTRGVPARER